MTSETEWNLADLWYWLISFAVCGALWASATGAIAPELAKPFMSGLLPSGALVWIGAGALIVAEFFVARSAGPYRASPAELAWNTRETPPAIQLLQVIGATVLLALFGGILLLNIALAIGYSSAAAAYLAALLVVSVPATCALAAVRQRDLPGRDVPRWELKRADANVRGATFSLLSLNGEALRATTSLRDSGVRCPIIRTTQNRWLRLWWTFALRCLARLWKREAAIVLVVSLLLYLQLVEMGWVCAIFGCAWCSVSAARPWKEWVGEAHIRHSFARLRGADTAVLLGASAPPIFLAACCLLAMSIRLYALPLAGVVVPTQPAAWIPIMLLLPVLTIAARGRAAAAPEGSEHTVINTPELGPIPVGQIGRIASGWMGACVLAAASWANPAARVMVLVFWGSFLAASYGRFASRVKYHANAL